MDRKNGWKFLNQYGATTQRDIYGNQYGETVYPLPRPGEKWGPWFEHPNPAERDGKECGPGRWHVMNKISADYAPSGWWVWYAQGENIIGDSEEKFSCTRIRLRVVSRRVFWRIIRLGWCKCSDLRWANLRGANLRYADLSGANLSGAFGYKQ